MNQIFALLEESVSKTKYFSNQLKFECSDLRISDIINLIPLITSEKIKIYLEVDNS